MKKMTTTRLQSLKGDRPIVCLTAYTTPIAKVLDEHVDLILVGDSVGMVLHGFDSTVPVTLDMMTMHGAAVRRGTKKSLLVVDMPFGSYQESPMQAYRNAKHLMQETGCDAVKLEGGADFTETIYHLTSGGIPVMGHIGLLPQSVNVDGGYKIKGRDSKTHKKHLEDAKAIEQAGVFAFVIEGTTEKLATKISKAVSIPTIGIGSGVGCDGQILVTDDMINMFPDFTPTFLKKYADAHDLIEKAVKDYTKDVKSKKFPGSENSF